MNLEPGPCGWEMLPFCLEPGLEACVLCAQRFFEGLVGQSIWEVAKSLVQEFRSRRPVMEGLEDDLMAWDVAESYDWKP